MNVLRLISGIENCKKSNNNPFKLIKKHCDKYYIDAENLKLIKRKVKHIIEDALENCNGSLVDFIIDIVLYNDFRGSFNYEMGMEYIYKHLVEKNFSLFAEYDYCTIDCILKICDSESYMDLIAELRIVEDSKADFNSVVYDLISLIRMFNVQRNILYITLDSDGDKIDTLISEFQLTMSCIDIPNYIGQYKGNKDESSREKCRKVFMCISTYNIKIDDKILSIATDEYKENPFILESIADLLTEEQIKSVLGKLLIKEYEDKFVSGNLITETIEKFVDDIFLVNINVKDCSFVSFDELNEYLKNIRFYNQYRKIYKTT